MKQTINYAYNLQLGEVVKENEIGHFILNNDYYYFVPLKRDQDELNDIILCSSELKQKGIECHDIIVNKDGKVITIYNNFNYVLLKVIGDINTEYFISDIVKINEKTELLNSKSKLYRNNWEEMWSSKIDYFEYQISEIGKNKKIVLDSFSYYVGLGELAISYVNKTLRSYNPNHLDKISLCHRRIFYPNIKLNYLNPLSFIFDLEIRDIAEYIKVLFFHNQEAYEELELFLKLRKLNIYSYQLLYARLIYPSYYFDLYEKIMNSSLDEEKLINIISLANNYELFLKKAYFLISKYAPIEKIDWILNKKEL